MPGGPRGPKPKNPALLQRRNKTATRAELGGARAGGEDLEEVVIRALPVPAEFTWLDSTRDWWKELWHSPMAKTLIRMDVPALHRMGHIYDSMSRWRQKEEKHSLLIQDQDNILAFLRSMPIETVLMELQNAVNTRARLGDQLLKIGAHIVKLEGEMRAHEQRYGLTQLDRWRLQVHVEPEFGQRRAKKATEEHEPAPNSDPRANLSLLA
jgi:hypothetical protein